jgi:pyruvate dehydrogenase E1 component beta subunit
MLYGQSFDVPKLDDYVLPIGKARIVREGKDVTLVSYSIGVGYALEAADELAKEGIEAEVIDLRTLRPLERWRTGFDDLDAPVLRVTNVDVPLPYAANLEKLALIKVADVVEAAKKVCYR